VEEWGLLVDFVGPACGFRGACLWVSLGQPMHSLRSGLSITAEMRGQKSDGFAAVTTGWSCWRAQWVRVVSLDSEKGVDVDTSDFRQWHVRMTRVKVKISNCAQSEVQTTVSDLTLLRSLGRGRFVASALSHLRQLFPLFYVGAITSSAVNSSPHLSPTLYSSISGSEPDADPVLVTPAKFNPGTTALSKRISTTYTILRKLVNVSHHLTYRVGRLPLVVTLASKLGSSLSLSIFSFHACSAFAAFFLVRAVFHRM